MAYLSPVLHWLLPFFRGMLFGLLAMSLHECGHLIAARVLGVQIRRVSVQWKGLCTVRQPGPPLKNLVISLAGPLMNAVLILTWSISPIFSLANMCFAFFNILPIEGSDGARALDLWARLKRETLNCESSQHRIRRIGLLRVAVHCMSARQALAGAGRETNVSAIKDLSKDLEQMPFPGQADEERKQYGNAFGS